MKVSQSIQRTRALKTSGHAEPGRWWHGLLPLALILGGALLLLAFGFLALHLILALWTGTADAKVTLRKFPASAFGSSAAILALSLLRHVWRTFQARKAIRNRFASMEMKVVRCEGEHAFVDCGSIKAALLYAALFYFFEAEPIGRGERRRYAATAHCVRIIGLFAGAGS